MVDANDEIVFEWQDPASERREGADPASEPPAGWKGSVLQARMRDVYVRLKRLVASLEESPLDIRADYDVPDAGPLQGLRQGGYKLRATSRHGHVFSLRFRCVGDRRLTFRADSRTERDDRMRGLAALGLDAIVEDAFGSQWHFTIAVRPMVPVTLRFEADVPNQVMRMAFANIDGLGVTQCSVPADAITPEFLDELERLVLRRTNRFAELTGNVVDNRVRRRMREAIEARQRRRAAELGDEAAGPEQPPASGLGGIKRLLGRRTEEQAERAATATPRPAAAPTFVGPRDDEGALDWNAGKGGAQVVTPPPVGKAVPTYGWLITKGDVEDTAANLGKLGPPGAARQFPVARVLTQGQEFRLRDREGRVTYTGKIAGNFRGPEPVNDFGLDHGCMRIEYLRDGKWVELKLPKD